MSTKNISIVVTGKVQQVGFRKSAQEEALRLGITGTIQNVGTDKVHLEASGAPDQIDLFTSWCRKGPESAKIEHIEVKRISQRNFTGFTVIRNRK
jgi:acylphosphatase